MKLLMKQRIFSWFDSYDIYNEFEEAAFTVQGKLSWGHRLEISDASGHYLGRVQEEILTFLPKFSFYLGEEQRKIGELKKEFTFFKPVYTLSCKDWIIEGNWLEWNYTVKDSYGDLIMQVDRELFHFSDTYSVEIVKEENALLCLMILLSIDAANCSNN